MDTAETAITEDDALIEFTTREEYINCSVNALTAISEATTFTKADEERKKRVTKRCIKIIDTLTKEMYDELFDESEEED